MCLRSDLSARSNKNSNAPWRHVQVVSPPPATEETGGTGREIETRQGIGTYKILIDVFPITNMFTHLLRNLAQYRMGFCADTQKGNL
jgi:hypothetical protein